MAGITLATPQNDLTPTTKRETYLSEASHQHRFAMILEFVLFRGSNFREYSA